MVLIDGLDTTQEGSELNIIAALPLRFTVVIWGLSQNNVEKEIRERFIERRLLFKDARKSILFLNVTKLSISSKKRSKF